MICNQNCDQGRTCNCGLKQRNLFLDVMEGFVTLSALVGIVANICFAFGFYWYRT